MYQTLGGSIIEVKTIELSPGRSKGDCGCLIELSVTIIILELFWDFLSTGHLLEGGRLRKVQLYSLGEASTL